MTLTQLVVGGVVVAALGGGAPAARDFAGTALSAGGATIGAVGGAIPAGLNALHGAGTTASNTPPPAKAPAKGHAKTGTPQK